MHKYSVTLSFNLYAVNLQTRIFNWSDANSVNKLITAAFFNSFTQHSVTDIYIVSDAVGCVLLPAATDISIYTILHKNCLFYRLLHYSFTCNNFCNTFFFKENVFYKVPSCVKNSLYKDYFNYQSGTTVQPQIYSTFYSFDITTTIIVTRGLGSFIRHLVKLQEILLLDGLYINDFYFSFLRVYF